MASRPPRALRDGEVVELGGKRVRHIDTPHVPHAWESRLLFEETTRTLFCGDLFSHSGDGPALTDTDIVEPAKRPRSFFTPVASHEHRRDDTETRRSVSEDTGAHAWIIL